jgi:hypothetical protein
MLREPAHSPAKDINGRHLLLGGEILDADPPGGVFDQDMLLLVAGPSARVLLGVTGDPVPNLLETGQLSGIGMDHVAGAFALVVLHR